jgi:S-adenosylmethionine:tRNA ribosyltransferase-isomerase
MYSLKDFDFILPEALIAQSPAHPRDHARLLIYNRVDKTITDDYFYNLLNYLPADTTLVVNNSKVEKCRLRFGAMELFVLETMNDRTLRAMVRPGRKFRLGAEVVLAPGVSARVMAIEDDGLRTIVLNMPLDDARLDAFRLTPLPPYIAQDESLADEYQTVYADPLGSKAAPTAGLHFTKELLDKVRKSHEIAEVTLHVGLGTFAPVKSEDLSKHQMHAEWYQISTPAAEILNRSRHITAVGTTSVRTLESARQKALSMTTQGGKTASKAPWSPTADDTAIFITPGYSFTAVDALITNFHLPKSTLLMLVAALMGSVDELHRVYAHAIEQKYRFYSFGDAMLIV